ncbi:MAG: glycosyltransferase [Alphaproteobacteria bacterium]|nr:MAG: glycosyltransferase [Alphaproteobacteria bacterium]
MPLFTVVIPTYNHADPIVWAIRSIQAQTVQDFEVIVAGDGVGDDTRAIMARLCAEDDRVIFHDNEKAPRRGEANRHKAVMAARGHYIAYLGDDDLWHEKHLETLASGLQDADFCNTLHTGVHPNGRVVMMPGNIGSQMNRNTLLLTTYNFFGPTCAGHSREAYLKLPEGWAPAPPGLWTDLYMWRKWFVAPGMRFRTVPKVTTIHIDSGGRHAMTPAERAAESKLWLEKISDPVQFAALEEQAFGQMALEQGCFKFWAEYFKAEIDKRQKPAQKA